MDYLFFLQQLRESAPDAVNLAFYYLSELIGGLAPIVIGVIIFWCIDKKGGYLVMSCYIACTAINQIIKNVVCMYRPWIVDARIHPYEASVAGATGYSFPSGHTAVSVGFFGGLAMWFKDKKWVMALCVILIVLVAFSRNWLGCHSLQDTLFSVLFALLTMLLTSWILQKVDEGPNYDLVVSAVLFVASIAFTLFCAFKAYPMDYDSLGNLLVDPNEMVTDCYRSFGALFGISISWPIERHFIKFSADGTTSQRVIRCIVGLIGLACVFAFGKLVVPLVLDAGVSRFVEYALIVIFAVAVYPALFTWFKRRRAARKAQ